MIVDLNLDTVKTLVSPGGDSPLVKAIYLKQHHKAMARLHMLRQRLLAEAPGLVEVTGFDRAFEAVSKFPAAAQREVLTYPAVAFWNDVAWDLARRRSHIGFPDMHIQTHLEEFGRVGLAVALKSGSGRFECDVRADGRGRVSLPGTGAYLQPPGLVPYGVVRVKVDGESVAAGEQAVTHQVPEAIKGVELNAIDTDLQLPGRTSFNYETLEPGADIKWRSTMEQAWAWIAECSPALAGEMPMSLRAIIPVRSSAVDVHASASFREAPGLIALSWTPDASIMAEALVHEYHHQKLNALLNLDPLISGPSGEAIYYSPWREDARPLLGVLHGAYAFQAVLQFWSGMFSAGIPLLHERRIRQRMYLLKAQVRTALASLREYAELSPLGEAFLAAMEENVDSIEVDLPITEIAVRQHLDSVQAEHRARWEKTNGARAGELNQDPAGGNSPIAWTDDERRALNCLGLNDGLDHTAPKGGLYRSDALLNAIISAHHGGGLGQLQTLLGGNGPGDSLLLNLIGGHVAYVLSQYQRAAMLYESCLGRDSANIEFWRFFAFALRHLARWEEADKILANIGILARPRHAARPEPGPTESDPVEERLEWVRHVLKTQTFASPAT